MCSLNIWFLIHPIESSLCPPHHLCLSGIFSFFHGALFIFSDFSLIFAFILCSNTMMVNDLCWTNFFYNVSLHNKGILKWEEMFSLKFFLQHTSTVKKPKYRMHWSVVVVYFLTYLLVHILCQKDKNWLQSVVNLSSGIIGRSLPYLSTEEVLYTSSMPYDLWTVAVQMVSSFCL